MRSKYLLSGLLPLLPLLLLLVACNPTKNKGLAEDGVKEFHDQLDRGQFQGIYFASGDQLKKVTSEADFTALLQAVHKKLGTVTDSKEQNFQMGAYIGQGVMVTLIYKTTFTQGTGTEKFTWHVQNDRVELVGYYITSNDLLK